MGVIPFAGSLSDKVGRKPMWYTSVIGLFVLALPMFWLMGQSFAWAIVAFAVLGLLYIPQLATITATFPAMFPSRCASPGSRSPTTWPPPSLAAPRRWPTRRSLTPPDSC